MVPAKPSLLLMARQVISSDCCSSYLSFLFLPTSTLNTTIIHAASKAEPILDHIQLPCMLHPLLSGCWGLVCTMPQSHQEPLSATII